MTSRLRIAVAADEPEMRDFCEKVLPRFGYQVVAVAGNGAQLVEYCRQFSGYHDAALIARAEADHVQACLVKPTGIADLPPTIAIAMRRFGELRALQRDCNDLRRALADRKVIPARFFAHRS